MSNTNQLVQQQKMARGLKFLNEGSTERVLFTVYSETNEMIIAYQAADLPVSFCIIMQKQMF